MYVTGSVHRGEAVRGASDVDLITFTTDGRTEDDLAWRRRLIQRWEAQGRYETPGFNPPRAVDDLDRKPAFRWTLRYDATLVYGRDLIAGEDIPLPCFGFETEWHLTRHAAGLEPENTTDFTLPQPLDRRLRKLARLAVLVGACVLMHRGRFRSFRGRDVLPVLEGEFRGWTQFLHRTDELYIHLTQPDQAHVDDYLKQLLEWMVWAADQIGESYSSD